MRPPDSTRQHSTQRLYGYYLPFTALHILDAMPKAMTQRTHSLAFCPYPSRHRRAWYAKVSISSLVLRVHRLWLVLTHIGSSEAIHESAVTVPPVVEQHVRRIGV
ncbi:hypothetical protein FOMPIDRAFT_1024555 [Fomitopsis schrenkii]|uniref:Uncharacterized protein n=1 Tax=Fomitopsis schrenkii TaxID=2126942 RepID=S8FAV0_FOMSC|nr:hypothetical protein FOMPIDRAFT_1024555 [Fomitopsis schrenkii]